MQLTRKKKIAAAVAAGAVVLASGGVAIAYWTSAGGGVGTADTSSHTDGITVTGNGATSGLAPGVKPETIMATVTNPAGAAAQSQFVTDLIVTITSISPDQTACAPTNYNLDATTGGPALTVSGVAPAGVQLITIPVGLELLPGQSVDKDFALGFIDDELNPQDGCQNASVNLTYATG
jgi:hypothetical protein